MQVVVVSPPSGGFPRHSHDEYVISVNVHGWEKVRLDRASFEVGVEEVTAYNPGQVQSCTTEATDGRPWSCVSLYVPVSEMLALTGGDLIEFARPVLHAPDLRHRLLASAGGAPVDLDSILVDMLSRGAGPPRPSEAALGNSRITWILERLRGDLSTAVHVTDVATEVGLSREQLIRSFTRAVGCSPYAWQLQARLAHGRRLLRGGAPIALAAREAGFADQSHFHKHFRAAYAMTPGQFRRTSTSDKIR